MTSVPQSNWMREAFGAALLELGQEEPRLVVVDAVRPTLFRQLPKHAHRVKAHVNCHQDECGACGLVGVSAEPAEDSLGEHGLARAEFADEGEQVAWTHRAPQSLAERECLLGRAGDDVNFVHGVHGA